MLSVFGLNKGIRETKSVEILVIRALWMFSVNLSARLWFGLMYQTGADSVIHSDSVAPDCALGRNSVLINLVFI